MVDDDNFQSLDIDPQGSLDANAVMFDELFIPGDTAIQHHEWASDLSCTSTDKSDSQMDEWCAWTRHGISLAVATAGSRPRLPSNVHVARARNERSHAECNADLVVHSWRAFPTMMLRRETLPWFIHPRSRAQSTPSNDADSMPEAITTCMGIAQMFASRTPETKQFLWRTIEREYQRFVTNVSLSSRTPMMGASPLTFLHR